jgi:HAD superfamily hydrolase (TIGR01549 family)
MLPDPATYDWIFFDCFNTLIADSDDSGETLGFCGLWHLAVELRLAQSIEELDARYLAWRLARRESAEAWREVDLEGRLRAVLGEALDRPGMLTRLTESWRYAFPRQTSPIIGVPAMLAYWKERKRLGVVSNFYVAGYPRSLLERQCLLPYLSFVRDSAELGIRKPDPRIYQEALRQAGVDDPTRVLFVGDSWRNDIEGPRQLGMQVLWYDRGDPERPEGADAVPSVRTWDAFR